MKRALMCCNNRIFDIDDFEGLYSAVAPEQWMLVCDKSFDYLPEKVRDIYYSHKDNCIRFDDFEPNPKYESAVKGVELLSHKNCSLIVAIGGGSTIDIAKCIKLFLGSGDESVYFKQKPCYDLVSSINLIALPTTAGTGSESTKHAVIYYEGVKQSICDDEIVPDAVILYPAVLEKLPMIHKKAAMLDALCQACESWWSKGSTTQSIIYSKKAVMDIVELWKPYISSDSSAAKAILLAANNAGRAINITKTTAAHAMSYKMTSIYGLPHGIAVALCFSVVWKYMIKKADKELLNIFDEIALCFYAKDADEAVMIFEKMLADMDIGYPRSVNREQDIELLVQSVNPERLSNNPIMFSSEELREMYEEIVK